MNLIVIHRNNNSTTSNGKDLLRFAVSSQPVAGVIFDGLSRSLSWGSDAGFAFAIPEEWFDKDIRLSSVEALTIPSKVEGWSTEPAVNGQRTLPYAENIPICSELLREIKRHLWFIVSNGRFATQVNSALLAKVLATVQTDIVAVNVEPELLAGHEKVRLTAQGSVAGIRRFYSDSVELAPLPADWPHHIFIKTKIFEQVLTNCSTLPQSFPDFIERCRTKALTLCGIRVGGTILDLETEDGLLNFCRKRVSSLSPRRLHRDNTKSVACDDNHGAPGSEEPRLVGKVLLGGNIEIGPRAIVIGPAIIGDNAKIGQDAVVNSSIIGPEVCVPQNQFLDNCIVKEPQCDWNRPTNRKSGNLRQIYPPDARRIYLSKFDSSQRSDETTFRTWPRFSYAGCFKRIADCFAATVVLILFAPVIPFIAIATKLSSPGPVFFKDKRQGLHGKFFNCLKFRTMLIGADKIQDKLRVVSQVDGPQFKIQDDPRLSTVGRFLRDTYIDEIPQFINVLLGQMSAVGPRPSPESENTLCPSWRDARLSVRPGITGLWQVCRTRRPTQDFQEWIHYDTRYVKNLSLRMDLWICWQTAKKMFENFIRQF
jgi:lipopolysaccharide/colanic/teichoic acid biosynthesis glycosyltransferase